MTTTAEKFTELRDWCAGDSPLYERLCEIVLDDSDLLALAGTVPDGRWPPHVFLSAVHALVLQGTDHPVTAYYPSASDDPRDPDEALAEHFRDFCRAREGDLRPLLESRRTQTNAVRRSAVLYPAIAHVAERVDGPLALIELGPSAGLNLLFDRYRYEYGDRVVGVPDSPVTVASEVRGDGDPPLPERPPEIRSRVGVDLNPLDVTDPDDARWLRALTWPEHVDRRRVLGDALALAREDPPEVVGGDMVDALPDLVESVPHDIPVCVVDTLVLYQVPDEVRETVTTTIHEYATERPLHWLSGDPEEGDAEGVPLDWTRETEAGVATDRLARFQPHGKWIEWRGGE